EKEIVDQLPGGCRYSCNSLASGPCSRRLDHAQGGEESGGLVRLSRRISDSARASEWPSADLFRQRGQLAKADRCARRRAQLLRTRKCECASRFARSERARDRALRKI